MRTPDNIPPDVRRPQSQVSNPNVSGWVAANAGSGKTHVLVQRVINLLLNGVEPEKILCITFTKAAAANMAKRFADADQPYRSLVHPMWTTHYGDYDHLARVKEWSSTGGAADDTGGGE